MGCSFRVELIRLKNALPAICDGVVDGGNGAVQAEVE